jgi:hypothetical protein
MLPERCCTWTAVRTLANGNRPREASRYTGAVEHRILAIAGDVTMGLDHTPVVSIVAVWGTRCLVGSVHDRHFYAVAAPRFHRFHAPV